MKEFIVYVFPNQKTFEAAKDILFGTFCDEMLIAISNPTVRPLHHPGHTRIFSVRGENNNSIVTKIKSLGLEAVEKGAI
jgi:hypothetical protein